MELERAVAEIRERVRSHIEVPDFRPGKVSVWTRFVRLVPADGTETEQTVGAVHKLLLPVNTADELLDAVAEHILLAVFGDEAPPVQAMPNLIVRLFDRKAVIATPGAPPLGDRDQIWLKVTVFSYSPSLWEQLFPRR